MSIKFGSKVRYVPREGEDPDHCPPSDLWGVVIGMSDYVCDDCTLKHNVADVAYETDRTIWTVLQDDLEVLQ